MSDEEGMVRKSATGFGFIHVDARKSECEHPPGQRVMRGWSEVCTICGKGRVVK